MGYHRKKRPCRPARQAFALLPVANGLDRYAEPGGKFELRQARAVAQVAYRRGPLEAKGNAGASGNSRPSRNSTIRPSAFSRSRRMSHPTPAGIVGDAR